MASEIFSELKTTIEEFKAKYDERYKALEKRIDGAEAAKNRMGNRLYIDPIDMAASADQNEHKLSFLNSFVRKGVDNGLRDMEIRAAVSTSCASNFLKTLRMSNGTKSQRPLN